jgi:hypothetical protein
MRETFGDRGVGYTTGYREAFIRPNLQKVKLAKTCKPSHKIQLIESKMENQSTAHTHFNGKYCPPATSCKPKHHDRQKNRENMNFHTEYYERYLAKK